MDAADISVLEVDDDNNNKENIPPTNNSVKEIDPTVVQDCNKLTATTGSRKLKRKFRMPLKDITNLLVVALPAQSSSAIAVPDLRLQSVVPSSIKNLNCKKRKALTAASADDDDDIDLNHKASSKILRKGFR